ncbi:DUF3995 domain-containing protein [Streptomyces sp. NPDC000345]|uniref:DUF3995 domain-containing protein n=1 Tax=Streptomyces sp. NPDC000345 TaxID=3364537 RepID=UPI003697E8F8
MNATNWLLGAPAGRTAEGGGGTEGASAGARVAGVLSASGLLAAGLLHGVWVFTPWPLASRAEFATVVVGVEESQLPSKPATFAVAALLCTAAWLVITATRPASPIGASRLVRIGLWTVSGVLAVRGLGGLAASGLALGNVPHAFRHWDLALYSPLCVTLASLTAYLALRTRHRRNCPTEDRSS